MKQRAGDDLLEEQNSATELVEENDDFDLDDIDSLIDEVSEQSDERAARNTA